MGCCHWLATKVWNCIKWTLGLTQIALCIAIICVIYYRLTDFEYDVDIGFDDPGVRIGDYKCLLGTDPDGRDMCVYGYVFCGITFIVALVLMLSMCCKCLCWVLAVMWIDLIFTVFGAVWWVAAAVVVTRYNADANKEDSPEAYWRNVVCGLSWVQVLLFTIQAIIAMCEIGYTVCGCCGGREAAEKRARELEKAKQEAHAKKLAAMEAKQTQPPEGQEFTTVKEVDGTVSKVKEVDQSSGCMFGACFKSKTAEPTPTVTVENKV